MLENRHDVCSFRFVDLAVKPRSVEKASLPLTWSYKFHRPNLITYGLSPTQESLERRSRCLVAQGSLERHLHLIHIQIG